AGGIVLAWVPNAGGGPRAQRVSSTPTLLWTATGVPLADPSDYNPAIAADGSGGLWAATSRWDGSNYTPYAHHLTNTGASTFAPAGIAFHGGRGNSFELHPVHDASPGCFVYGQVNSSGSGAELFRQQISLAGSLLRGPDGDALTY